MRPLIPTPLLLALALTTCGEGPPPILEKGAVLARQSWWDNRDWSWYQERIPFFESPDGAIDATYYYRWELVTKHLTYGSPETGYTFTEFIDRPFWSGAYGAISCPLGHQFYEVRWLKDRRIIEDFARYWFETPGAQPRSYSNWYGDAMWATYLVLGDTAFLRTVLPHMKAQYAGWLAEHWDPAHGMFRWDGMHDGMETNINSRQTGDEFAGAEGYRPTLNSYLYADALAISRAAAVLGDSARTEGYGARAATLKRRVQAELWDPKREFFFHQFAQDEQGGIKAKDLTYETGKHAGNPRGREEIGFVPWQFNLPDPGYEAAWKFLMDPAYFSAPFGPTTVERNDPQFYVSPRCCVWSGNSWPYATTQTLVAFANLLNNYQQSYVTKADYFRLLQTYTRTQRREGRPYIAEAADPFTGSWDGHNTFYHSEHYFHSGYVDLIITGLVGLRPRSDDTLEVNPLAPDDWPYFVLEDVFYRGRRVSVIWDRDGSRYERGAGLSLHVDGRRIAMAPALGRLKAKMPRARHPEPAQRMRNLAVNNGRGAYPWVTASYSAPEHPAFYAIDGNYWYHQSPPNRWTASGSGNQQDWLVLDFGVERPVETLKLYFLNDSTDVKPPARYEVQLWKDGAWVEVPDQRRSPAQPGGRRANLVAFRPITTSKLRVVLTHRPGKSSGLTEIEAWARVPLPLAPPTAPAHNIAYGAAASASFSAPGDSATEVNDLRIAFTYYSRNRWSALGSPHRRDWIQLDFGRRRPVRQVELYLWGDNVRVRAPRRFAVQVWDGTRWADVRVESQLPRTPTTWAVNTVRVEPVETEKLRVVFEHDLPAVSGVTELIVWDQIP
ncbi:MAG: discoidin domain-containing protein [Gemmatimonadetes bacterium]|nr:discoidin domain-containing protein [Gemmatimonadota bacterium]